jgi:hypothetical protein
MTDPMALLGTVAWILVVVVLLGLFGTTDGGAWSIAGGVARGVRDWAGGDGRAASAAPGAAADTGVASPETAAVTEELDDHPIR